MANTSVRQYAGDVRFWEKAPNGTLTPVIPEPTDPDGNQPVETNALTFSYEAGDEIKVPSKRRGARFNQPIYSDALPGTTDVSVTLLELPPLMLARIVYGEASTAVISAGTEVGETITVGAVNAPIQLSKRLVSDIVVKKSGTPLVLGTDYTTSVDGLRRGQIMPKDGGAIAKGDTLEIGYDYAAQVSTSILGGATPSKKFYITVDLEDRISTGNAELRIPEVSLSVDGDVDWFSDEPITATMKGTAIVAAGESAPYTLVAYKAS